MDKNLNSTAATPKYASGNCDSCEFYEFDEEWGEYVCAMSLDEDEMVSFLNARRKECPYFKLYDEYAIVRKQN